MIYIIQINRQPSIENYMFIELVHNLHNAFTRIHIIWRTGSERLGHPAWHTDDPALESLQTQLNAETLPDTGVKTT